MKKKIILGSQSPRRKSLLKKIVSNFEIIKPDFDEKLDTDVYSDEIIKNFSLEKAKSILFSQRLENSIIVSADTVVVYDNKILGKPKNEENAFEMLSLLSGKTHFVVTAVTVMDCDTKECITDVVKTFVTFQDLSKEKIERYIKDYNPLDKAGSYGIQEMDESFIKNVDGCLDNVVGLPVKKLSGMLRKFQ